MFLPAPRGLADPQRVVERRVLAATAPAVQPLRLWAAAYAATFNVVVPDFDPAEAGVNARVLFVLEAPGPMTNNANVKPGSGFISVDNDDPTAANLWRSRNKAGLNDGALHWNIVPRYLGAAARKPTGAELGEGARALVEVVALMPQLRVVVLCGRHAQNGWARYVGPRVKAALPTLSTWHPSPLALNTPARRQDFDEAVREAGRRI